MLTSTVPRATAIAACIIILAACSGGTSGVVPQSAQVRVPPRSVAAVATQRNIADFLAAQGTFCVPPSTGVPPGAAVVDGCVLFVPPDPNFNGWAVATPAPYCSAYTLAAVDYSGIINQYLIAHGHASLGTTVSGTVSERALKDGSGEVTVNLNTKNALAWAGCDPTRQFDFFDAAVLFGNKPDAVLAGATPALAHSSYQIVYTEAHVGAPFPDLTEINFGFGGYAYRSQKGHITADGPLQPAFGVPSGTPGHLVIGQTGLLYKVGDNGKVNDGFTAEFIHITEK